MEPNGYKAIWVRWLDSAGESGWVGRADGLSQRVVEVYHLGFLIQEDDRQITLSPTTYVDGGDATCPYHSPVAIPKIAILARGSVKLETDPTAPDWRPEDKIKLNPLPDFAITRPPYNKVNWKL